MGGEILDYLSCLCLYAFIPPQCEFPAVPNHAINKSGRYTADRGAAAENVARGVGVGTDFGQEGGGEESRPPHCKPSPK